jgi:hypothetical protein
VLAAVIFLLFVFVNYVLYLFVADQPLRSVIHDRYRLPTYLFTLAVGAMALGSAATLAAPLPKP